MKAMIEKKGNLESMSISELRKILLDSDNLNLLEKLGISKKEIEEVLKKKRVFRLAEKLFGETSFLTPTIEVTCFEYDFMGEPKTQNAAAANVEMTISSVVSKVIEKILEASDNGELEELLSEEDF